jgi:acyl-CoA thioester hydrolase
LASVRVPIEVIYRDLDAMGHVNNAVYFSYFELGRQKYWEAAVGLKTVFDIAFVVASASIDYRRPAHLGDRLSLDVRLPRTGTSSFDFVYSLTRGGEPIAAGKTTQVLWDWETQSKRTFTPELLAAIARVEGDAP